MNGYNPNYFNRKTVESMKSALSQVFNEQFPGTEQGQPGLGINQISDLELQKRMRNKKNTSIFNKNPKQSKEYLDLEAEYNRRQAAAKQAAAKQESLPPFGPEHPYDPYYNPAGENLDDESSNELYYPPSQTSAPPAKQESLPPFGPQYPYDAYYNPAGESLDDRSHDKLYYQPSQTSASKSKTTTLPTKKIK